MKSGFLLLLFLACCQQSSHDILVKEPISSREMDIEILDQQLDEIELLCRNLKVDDYLKYFSADAVIFPPGAPPIKGIDHIRSFFSAFEETFNPSFEATYSQREYQVDDSLAVRSYVGFAYIRYLEGNDTLVSHNKYVDYLRKQADGTWKIKWHIWNAMEN